MSKTKLSLDALEVESFATGAAEAEIGTVRGRMDVPRESDAECTIIIVPKETQAKTCPWTCWDTCQMTCITACSCITLPCAGCA